MSTMEFRIGDAVCVGEENSKIVDIHKPLGTYSVYSVRTYTGNVLTADRHELVQCLDDSIFEEDIMDIFDINAGPLPKWSKTKQRQSLCVTRPSINETINDPYLYDIGEDFDEVQTVEPTIV